MLKMSNPRPVKPRVITNEQLEKVERCGCASSEVRKLIAKELLQWRKGERKL